MQNLCFSTPGFETQIIERQTVWIHSSFYSFTSLILHIETNLRFINLLLCCNTYCTTSIRANNIVTLVPGDSSFQ